MTSEWYQHTLMAPEVYEATVKVGVIPERDHVQVWWELKDPTTGVLVAQGSEPHATLHSLRASAQWAIDRVLLALDEHTEPF